MAANPLQTMAEAPEIPPVDVDGDGRDTIRQKPSEPSRAADIFNTEPEKMPEPVDAAAAGETGEGVDDEADNKDILSTEEKDITKPLLTPQDTMPSSNTVSNRILQFLSTVTPTTLAAIAVGFAGVTYAVLGQFGLVIVGAVGGVISFIVWEGRNPEIARAVKGEKGPDALERLWADLDSSRALAAKPDDAEEEDNALKSFDDFGPETKEAVTGLLDAIIRDYIKWWYSPIIPTDHSFPLACRKGLTAYILAISNRMCKKRPADAFLDLLTNSSSIAIAFMSELAGAFADVPPESSMTAVDVVYNYLASNPESRLNTLLNQRQQAAKFRMVAEDLLSFLEPSAYDCDPARIFLREILANTVLETTLQICSKPEWINGWIVYLLEAGEPDLNQAIDVGMQTGPDSSNNILFDLDGNMGNVGIAKPGRFSGEYERGRRKESLAHRKKLSKADEEMEEAISELKRTGGLPTVDSRGSVHVADSERGNRSLEIPSIGEEPISQPSWRGHERSMTMDERSSAISSSTDGRASRNDTVFTPATPQSSTMDSASQESTSPRHRDKPFTNFEQLVPNAPEAEPVEEDMPRKAPLTLHNASFTIHDDSSADDARIKSKPNWDYLIQVEPSSSDYPGWMIVRRYSDFETLHEILRRIATVSGATAFTELHKELPSWKVHVRESLRGELERYLRDACWYQSLAESEGMKRFLEKSQGHTHGASKSFAWDAVGKNMLDVLTNAPKGAMEGGKTLVGGVTGVFGNFPGIARKPTASQSVDLSPAPSRLSLSTPGRGDILRSSPARSERTSIDSQRSSVISTQPGKMPPMERRGSFLFQSDNEGEGGMRMGRSERMGSVASASVSARPSREHSRASSLAPVRSPSAVSLDHIRLPPPPDEISDDYESPGGQTSAHPATIGEELLSSPQTSTSAQATPSAKAPAPKSTKSHSQMTEGETRVAVELLFAVINEMYTLSSAWNIRRTLLTAAKSFLLRPGNPSLLTVQSIIQTSVLDAHTSDAGIAAHLKKIRENAMPTEAERAEWPAELTAEEKEKLAIRARELLIKSGVPAALMGVMGQAATGEALGRVFDCLQIEEVARGLIFGLISQAVKVLTH